MLKNMYKIYTREKALEIRQQNKRKDLEIAEYKLLKYIKKNKEVIVNSFIKGENYIELRSFIFYWKISEKTYKLFR